MNDYSSDAALDADLSAHYDAQDTQSAIHDEAFLDVADEIATNDRYSDEANAVVRQMAEDPADLANLIAMAVRMSTLCRVQKREDIDIRAIGSAFYRLVDKHVTSYCEAKAEEASS